MTFHLCSPNGHREFPMYRPYITRIDTVWFLSGFHSLVAVLDVFLDTSEPQVPHKSRNTSANLISIARGEAPFTHTSLFRGIHSPGIGITAPHNLGPWLSHHPGRRRKVVHYPMLEIVCSLIRCPKSLRQASSRHVFTGLILWVALLFA